MRNFTLICLTLLITTMPSSLWSAWWYVDHTGRVDPIRDDFPYEFKRDSITCLVSKANPAHALPGGGAVVEDRILTCNLAKGINVTIRAYCNYPSASETNLTIEKDGKMYSPGLRCAPK